MERYTKRTKDGQTVMDCATCPASWIDRQGERCTALYCRNRLKDRLAEIEDIFDNYDVARLRELVTADKEGRCVVLPCKVGTTVYSVRHQMIPDDEYRMSFHEELSIVSQKFGLHHADCIDKTVFLTREAAEAALAEKGASNG